MANVSDLIPSVLDENLRPYATDRQWEILTCVVMEGTIKGAAERLGVGPKVIRTALQALYIKAAQRGYAPAFDLTKKAAPGFVVKGTSTLYNEDGTIREQWNKTKLAGIPPEDAVPPLPVQSKVSTNYDEQGNVKQQWVQTKQNDLTQACAWEAAARAMAEPLPRVPGITLLDASAVPDLLSCYPVGDHHLGMLSWPTETDGDWDVKIGERALMNAIDYLLASTPPSEDALIPFLGDFMHYDSFETVTPTSRNLLDADGRYPKMVEASIRAMRYTIEAAAARHALVRVIVEIGNHDLSSSIFLMQCLANIYADNPRISIDTSPKHYHYYEYGKTLIGTHHGHGAKPDRLPSIMAADRPEAWGRTRYRYWWTGHIHHTTVKDYEACSVESFRILAPSDAWAHQKGFRAMRDMKAIVIHREYGEVARHTVRPSMFLDAPEAGA